MKSKVTVRLAVHSDATEISRILLEAFSVYRRFYTEAAFEQVTPTSNLIKGRLEEGPIWVAEVDDEIVGTVSVIKEP
jgi:hypothetical protein